MRHFNPTQSNQKEKDSSGKPQYQYNKTTMQHQTELIKSMERNFKSIEVGSYCAKNANKITIFPSYMKLEIGHQKNKKDWGVKNGGRIFGSGIDGGKNKGAAGSSSFIPHNHNILSSLFHSPFRFRSSAKFAPSKMIKE
jgi:hypothetical protein